MKKSLIVIIFALLSILSCGNLMEKKDYEIIKPVQLVIKNDGTMLAVNETFIHIKRTTIEDDRTIITYWFEVNDYGCRKMLEERLGILYKGTIDSEDQLPVEYDYIDEATLFGEKYHNMIHVARFKK